MASNEQDSIVNGLTSSSTENGPAKHIQEEAKNTTVEEDNPMHGIREETPQITANGEISENGVTTNIESPKFGTSCTVNKLWEGRSATDQPIWLTEPPKLEAEDELDSGLPDHAITLWHRAIREGGKQNLDTMIIRGPKLRQLLEDIIPNISSFYNEAEHGIAIRAPFRWLFWNLNLIEAAAKGQDAKLSKEAALLHDVLKEQFHGILAKRKELLVTQEINFDLVWTIFKPGMTCLTTYASHVIAVKLTSIDYSHDPMGKYFYRIKYRYLSWDGQSLGWQDSNTDIEEFGGRRKIKNLEIIPIEYANDPNLIDQLISRGKRFVEIAIKEPYMMSFNGETLDREASPMWWQGEQKKKMSERVILDARAYNHYYRRLYVETWMRRAELPKLLTKDQNDQRDLLYCSPEFHCYALQPKKWVRCWIDDVDEVGFNESAYPSLVLPGDYKELLLAFAEAQIDGYGFDDVIAGKGQGILMLLAGPPGIGKTLTAEAIAEHMKRPLYSVSAGELGASAGGMENELDRVLELCTRWNAILLLDEADVFLERRTDNDLQRNTIVSVFLRKLEYYRGIMFLTTNRIHSFDEAFKSRIHVAMRYPDLDTQARRTIWGNFLKKAQDIYQHGVEVSTEELDQLSQRTLNGREIRNIIKSAQLLASRSKQPLKKSHLDIIWRVEHENSVWDQLGASQG